MAFTGFLPSKAHRFGEGSSAPQSLVKARREQLRRTIIHRPSGRDDAAHADADEFLGYVGGEARPLVAERTRLYRRAGIDLSEIAAVDERELGHSPHRLDFARTKHRIVGEHDPSGPIFDKISVPCDMDDPVWLIEHRVDDRERIQFQLRLDAKNFCD